MLTSLNNFAISAFMLALDFVPDVPEWLDLATYAQKFVDLYNYISWYFPLSTALIILGIIFAMERLYYGYWLVAKIIKLLSFGFVDL